MLPCNTKIRGYGTRVVVQIRTADNPADLVTNIMAIGKKRQRLMSIMTRMILLKLRNTNRNKWQKISYSLSTRRRGAKRLQLRGYYGFLATS